jgi:hypothetical protein
MRSELDKQSEHSLTAEKHSASFSPMSGRRPEHDLRQNGLLSLHRQIGNRAMGRLLAVSGIQAKLKVSTPDDEYEREAERLANLMMRMPGDDVRPDVTLQNDCRISSLQGAAPPVAPESNPVSRIMAGMDLADCPDVLGAGCHRLGPADKAFFEPRFGRSLDSVRLHTDAMAARTAQALNARAFTVGSHVVFGPREYSPGSIAGRRLLAHELVHVIQQIGDNGSTNATNGSTILWRVPGDVATVNLTLLTLYLSQYEGSSQIPPEATAAYLTEPDLLAMAQRLRDAVRQNADGGNPPLGLDQFYELALAQTGHRGTALLLCHNVARGFARSSSALGITRLNSAAFYRLFDRQQLGDIDTGDWYHYFVIALMSHYHAAGAVSSEHPFPDEAITRETIRRDAPVGAMELVKNAMRDEAIAETPAYTAWRYANALSFLEGAAYGHSQGEVNGESSVHLVGAIAGIEQAGGDIYENWVWYVPISGSMPRGDMVRGFNALTRLAREGIEVYTFDILNTAGELVRHVNDRVPPPAPAAVPPSPPPQPEPEPPSESGPNDRFFGRKSLPGGPDSVAPIVTAPGFSQRLGVARTCGKALPISHRRFYEARLGIGLSDVRLHDNPESHRLNREVGAQAFTLGRDIYFGENQQPRGMNRSGHLLAHELVHVLQQRRGLGVTEPLIQRFGGEPPIDPIHEPLIEAYRAALGLPPGGIDPDTGQQVGPTDAEIKYGGLLGQRIASRPAVAAPRAIGNVLAPGVAPTLPTVAPVHPDLIRICGRPVGTGPARDAQAACVTHLQYVNDMAQIVSNISRVASPYAPAIAGIYRALLQQVIAAGTGTPPTSVTEQTYTATNLTVQLSTGVQFPVPRLQLTLFQQLNGPNGSYANGVFRLNEVSYSALVSNVTDIERTLYHEAFHFLEALVTDANRQARQASTAGHLVHLELDAATYAGFEQAYVNAAAVIWEGFLNSSTQWPPGDIPRRARQLAGAGWALKVRSEIVVRAEEQIYLRLRTGRGFTEADLRALPQNWLYGASYWPSNFSNTAVQSYLTAHQTDIDAGVTPVIQDIQIAFMRRRPI